MNYANHEYTDGKRWAASVGTNPMSALTITFSRGDTAGPLIALSFLNNEYNCMNEMNEMKLNE